MKPDWDKLASEFANSDKVLIADVDCTGPGEPLCERFGVEGFPTIKSFAPPDTEGEDYEGGRDLEALREHASSLGPGCSATSKDNCSPDQLKELEDLLAKPEAELLKELEDLKTQLDDSKVAHDKLVESLQEQYEASEKGQAELKKELSPRMKMLRAATAKAAAPSGDKDEM